jgi:hypothetical protein
MKSPRWEFLLVPDRSFQRQRFLGDLEHLAHLLERHAELLGKLLGRGLAPDLVEQLPAFAYDLGDSAIAVLKTAEDRLR